MLPFDCDSNCYGRPTATCRTYKTAGKQVEAAHSSTATCCARIGGAGTGDDQPANSSIHQGSRSEGVRQPLQGDPYILYALPTERSSNRIIIDLSSMDNRVVQNVGNLDKLLAFVCDIKTFRNMNMATAPNMLVVFFSAVQHETSWWTFVFAQTFCVFFVDPDS